MTLPIDMINQNNDSTEGLRKYCKYYDGESYKAGTHLKRFANYDGTAQIITYRVIFYTGPATEFENDTSLSTGKPCSVNEFFNTDGKCNVSSYYSISGKTRNEIVEAIEDTLDEFTDLNFGFTFTLEKYSSTQYYFEDTVSNVSNSGYHHFYIWGRYPAKDLKGGAIWSVIAPGKINTYGLLKYFPGNATSDANGPLRHEMGHVFGLVHNSNARGTKELTVDGKAYTLAFGNPNLSGMYAGEGEGFIAKPSKGQTVESYVCAYDVIYNKSGNTRIYGDVSGVYPNIKTFWWNGLVGEEDHPDKGKNFYEYGRCRALLIDGYKKEVMYEMPIDYTGHFSFSLRIVPSVTLAPFTVLVVSKEFHHSFISRNTNNETDISSNVYIRNTVNGVQKTYSYTCVKSHRSDNFNKPLLGSTGLSPGSNWYDYWEELGNTDPRISKSREWKINTTYQADSFIYKPLYGYIWYQTYGPYTSLVIGSDNNVGTLKIGGTNGEKRVKTIEALEEITGFKLKYYNITTTSETKTQVENKATLGKTVFDWQLFCKSS